MFHRLILGPFIFLVASSCGGAEQSDALSELLPHQRLLAGFAESTPLPTGPWKGVGESTPKRLALVSRERELLALARTDPSPVTHRMLGSLYTTVGEGERGLAFLAHSLSNDPSDAEAWTWLGANRLDHGNFDQAITLLEHASSLAPTDTHSLSFLGISYMRFDDLVGARRAFEKALAIDPEHNDALVPLASLLEDEGDLEGALTHLLVANRVLPNQATTLFRLARVSEDLGQAEAATEFRLAHERVRVLEDLGLLGPSISEVQRRVSLGIHYLESGRAQEAIPEFDYALQFDAESNVRINALLGRALCMLALKRFDDAEQAIEAFSQFQPGHPEVLKLKARLATAREAGE
ncbi:MAG: Flp pilus assembly protein TadD [Planctomycetota bacterium]|jgi:Flp pilus assembly protein TadD